MKGCLFDLAYLKYITLRCCIVGFKLVLLKYFKCCSFNGIITKLGKFGVVMKYILAVVLSLFLMSSYSNANENIWKKPTEDVGLAKAFELVGKEASARSIADMDFASVLQKDTAKGVLFKIELANVVLGTQIDDPNVNLPKVCDLVTIKYLDNKVSLVSWQQNGCSVK